MKSSNIADSVFKVNLKYVDLQNKTKELFFRCLDEKKSVAYFNEELHKIWGDVDYSFMQNEISNYEDIIHERNIDGKEIIQESTLGDVLALVPISVIIGVENKFVKQKIKEYKVSLNSNAYKIDKDEYLKLKVQKYTDQIVPYYPHTENGNIRYVELSTYCSMIHNTNLTRSGWNITLRDGQMTGQDKYYIPYHSFSCPHCLMYQNRVMTTEEVIDLIGRVDTGRGELLHPNCKCTLTFYDKYSQFNRPDYSKGELEEQYNIRQKTNSLTLKKEKLKTDIKIQQSLGNQDEVDKLNQQRNAINKQIRELKQELPTKELRKQVIAINR